MNIFLTLESHNQLHMYDFFDAVNVLVSSPGTLLQFKALMYHVMPLYKNSLKPCKITANAMDANSFFLISCLL